MSLKKESTLDWIFRVVAPKLTSVGAAIVIIGALFKIMHWPGAGLALTVGLLTEAFLFFIGAFQPAAPPEAHYEWERVYPELAGGAAAAKPAKNGAKEGAAAIVGIDKLLGAAGLDEKAFKNFGSGMKNLETSVSQIKNLSDTQVATEAFTKTTKDATASLSNLNKSYTGLVSSMTQMAGSSKGAADNAKEYHSQVQKAAKSLASLNAVYEMELKDADAHIKAMNKFYGNLAGAMSNMADASKESEVFKKQMSQLTGNMTSLNTIYGNMLSAMKG